MTSDHQNASVNVHAGAIVPLTNTPAKAHLGMDDWDVLLSSLTDKAQDYLQIRGAVKDQARALARAGATSYELHDWRQNTAFRTLEAYATTHAHELGPEMTVRKAKAASPLIMSSVLDDATNPENAPRDRTTAAQLALRIAGIGEGSGVTIAIQVNAGADAYHRSQRSDKKADVSIDKPHA